jgi:hypothetical protein
MTTVLPILSQLTIVGIFDRGVANRERLVLRPTEPVNLAHFFVTLSLRNETTRAVHPVADQAFWFPEFVLAPPSWIFLYTGRGTPSQSVIPATQHTAYAFHWGKDKTVFQDTRIVPAVFSFGSILVPGPQAD